MPTVNEAKEALEKKLPEQYRRSQGKPDPTPDEPPLPSGYQFDAHEIEMTKKRNLLKKARVMRERRRQLFGEVRKQDKNKSYIWVRNHPERLTERRGMGYEVVDKNHRAQTDYQNSDGRHIRGDTILMQCDRDLHEAHKTLPQIEALERVQGKYDDLLSWADSNRVPARKLEE